MTDRSADPPVPGSRPGRRALFSGPYDSGLATGEGRNESERVNRENDVEPAAYSSAAPVGPGVSEEMSGRRAFFSGAPLPSGAGRSSGSAPGASGARTAGTGEDIHAGLTTAVVECRTCLDRTPISLLGLGLSLVPSLWLPTRPWPRLMRCPACHRVSWCRIEWPHLRGSD